MVEHYALMLTLEAKVQTRLHNLVFACGLYFLPEAL